MTNGESTAGEPSTGHGAERGQRLHQRVADTSRQTEGGSAELHKLLHELNVYQTELEAQNLELLTTQERLEAARERLDELYTRAPLAYITVGEDDRIREANPAAARLLGADLERLQNVPLHKFITVHDQSRYREYRRRTESAVEAEQITLEMIRNDGTPFYGRIDSVRPVGGQYHVIISDVTRLCETEQALRRSEERYRSLLKNIPEVAWSMNTEGILTFVSPRVEEITGYHYKELVNTSPGRWQEFVHAEDRERLVRAAEALLREGKELDQVFRLQRRDGRWLWVRNHARCTQDERGELRVDGVLMDIDAAMQAQEQIQRFNIELADQLGEQRARIERMERRRADMEKIAATGRLAAAVAHEINNPLAGIKNSFELVKRAVPPDHPHHRFVELVDKELKRVSQIVLQMYLLYQPSPRTSRDCDLKAAVQDVLQILDSTVKSRGQSVQVTVEPRLPRGNIQEGEFKQVVYNIVHNAIYYSPQGGTIEIGLDTRDQCVRMTVVDHGPGIPAAVLPHIFEPFFSSRRAPGEGAGMGLGLSVTRSLVEAAGGYVEVDTREGQGTTFAVLVPAAGSGHAEA